MIESPSIYIAEVGYPMTDYLAVEYAASWIADTGTIPDEARWDILKPFLASIIRQMRENGRARTWPVSLVAPKEAD